MVWPKKLSAFVSAAAAAVVPLWRSFTSEPITKQATGFVKRPLSLLRPTPLQSIIGRNRRPKPSSSCVKKFLFSVFSLPDGSHLPAGTDILSTSWESLAPFQKWKEPLSLLHPPRVAHRIHSESCVMNKNSRNLRTVLFAVPWTTLRRTSNTARSNVGALDGKSKRRRRPPLLFGCIEVWLPSVRWIFNFLGH